MTGYLHPGYAASLSEFGTPITLAACGGSLLARPIPGSTRVDAMGCYPLFCCQQWEHLGDDLQELGSDVVAVSLVTDPFGRYEAEQLQRLFDVAYPFKAHLVADLHQDRNRFVSKHHRYYAQKVMESVQITVEEHPVELLEEWVRLYSHLTKRHALTGIKAFSVPAFRAQLQVPGMVALTARCQGRVVGAHLWYVQGEVAYSHLAASDEEGYRTMASYGLYWRAIGLFRDLGLRWMDIGAAAGGVALDNGLSRFKRGWATEDRTAYFCGKILDPAAYAGLCASAGQTTTTYFPAYRAGELTEALTEPGQ